VLVDSQHELHVARAQPVRDDFALRAGSAAFNGGQRPSLRVYIPEMA
jgi:hypothetical protein